MLNDESGLELEYWLRQFNVRVDPGTGQSSDTYFANRALHSHALAVQDRFQNFATTSTFTICQHLSSEDGFKYMRYGVGRRTLGMWYALRQIFSVAPPDRKTPLAGDNLRMLNQNLNSIYLDLRGVLDNLAWVVLFEAMPTVAKELNNKENQMRVGLFSKTIRSQPQLAGLSKKLSVFADWNQDVKSRRDPAAHRIPLAVPPAIVSKSEAAEYKTLTDSAMEAANSLDFDRHNAIHEQLDQIGRFVPGFAHDPAAGLVVMYPTIPYDMANLIKIGSLVFEFLTKTK